MAKTAEQSKALIDALTDLGYEPRSYSGRGMYGKECVAVTGVSVWNVAQGLFSEQFDEDFSELPEPKQDALGLGNVLYWPSYPWPEDQE